ncbi:S-layer homology domain-containing protein [Thermanaeromonas toyohensis ToBE]|uniref:S-layer homology domain-containing protein n=1 Tax=Thermanaeromonas toyohensis ToBE TaxID=698762 RepID=A0A1W1VX46_9FIRM|nr:trypsin-like peptidase domain-containing protein [Thermanaeromonas toyohensis]SMB97925.1 S-layer homology domain-containing protein [Thermanaeromonas toyohensis ToBE]
MYKDVTPDRWSRVSIEAVSKAGLMSGYPDGTFQPEKPLTREEMASILHRWMFRNGLFDDILPAVMPSIVMVHTGTNLGSGACIANDQEGSYIITNNHVVGLNTTFTLMKENSENFPGEIVVADQHNDLALIKTAKTLPPLKLAEQDPALGEPVAVIGAPAGLIESVTVGIISNLSRQGGKWLQLDAPINPGNSGGPVINERGEIVGIAVAKIVGEAFEGLGYAIKLQVVKDFLARVADKIR